MEIMARIVGSTFKPRLPARQQPQETAMDRALASFVSPQGVYLLAQGIGALGKLPWQSKEGGVGLMKQAAASRNAEAKAVLKQAEALHKDIKPGFTDKEVQIQRDAVMPYEAEEVEGVAARPVQGAKLRQAILAQGQREGETPAEFKARFEGRIERTAADVQDERRLRTVLEKDVGKPEDRAVTAQGARMEAMIKAAREAGRDVDKVDLPMMDEESLQSKLEHAFKDTEVSTEDLQDLSMEELMDQAVNAQTANRKLRASSVAIQDMFGQQLDPFLVQQNIEASVKRRQEYNQRVRSELKRRATTIQAADPVKFIEGRIAKQIAGLDPVEQKAELRRLAKSVRTQEDKDEVMSLAARFKPVRSTVGDYFTSDDDLRTEFEEELNKILPTIDPLFAVKKRQLTADAIYKEAQAEELTGRAANQLAIEMYKADAKSSVEAGKRAEKRAAKGTAARDKEDKKLEGMKKSFARAIRFQNTRVEFLRDADNIFASKAGYKTKYAKLHALTRKAKYKKAFEKSAAAGEWMAAQQMSEARQTAKGMPDEPDEP